MRKVISFTLNRATLLRLLKSLTACTDNNCPTCTVEQITERRIIIKYNRVEAKTSDRYPLSFYTKKSARSYRMGDIPICLRQLIAFVDNVEAQQQWYHKWFRFVFSAVAWIGLRSVTIKLAIESYVQYLVLIDKFNHYSTMLKGVLSKWKLTSRRS